MNAYTQFGLHNQSFLLTGCRTIFWEEEKLLILSDLHLGKSGHFRKSGIAIPQTVFREDLQRLVSQVQYFKPSSLLVVGDLFHSTENKEHELFKKWWVDLGVDITLVRGNHDILGETWYRSSGISLAQGKAEIGDFIFTHDFSHCGDAGGKYCFSGHVHPGVRLSGFGKQSVRLPCFYFGRSHAILPAFGKFTGIYIIEPKKEDTVFVIAEGKVIRV